MQILPTVSSPSSPGTAPPPLVSERAAADLRGEPGRTAAGERASAERPERVSYLPMLSRLRDVLEEFEAQRVRSGLRFVA